MLRVLEDVLAREAPVSPAEVAHLVQRGEVQARRARVGERKRPRASARRPRVHPLEKPAVVARPVGAEVAQDLGQRVVRHRELEQVVAQRDLRA
jgi:hypothetical protein